MPMHYVEYPLQDGFVHNWLVAGPQTIPVQPDRWGEPHAADVARHPLRQAVLRHYYMAKAGIGATPVERGPLDAGQFTIGKWVGAWSYLPCPDDHTIDHSGYYRTLHYLRSWAYVEVVSAQARQVHFALTTDGAADLWLGETHLGRVEPCSSDPTMPAVHTFTTSLAAGVTPLLARFENAGRGHVAHILALRLLDPQGAPVTGVHVRFRTLIDEVARRNAFEQLSAAAFMERDVYAGETMLALCWPPSPRANCFAHVRLQAPDGRIFLAGDSAGGPGERLNMGHAIQHPAGRLYAVIMPHPNEVYLQHIRLARTLPLWSLGRGRYQAVPWGDLAARRHEALLAAAREPSVFAQVARMAWGAWGDVSAPPLLEAIARVDRREIAGQVELLALLGMVARWGDHAAFPAAVHDPLQAAALGYRYAAEGAGHEDAGYEAREFGHEVDVLLFLTCELLAGQRYADQTFDDGQRGAWHQARAETGLQAWLTRFGTHGLAAWNVPDALEMMVAALTHLCDLAASEVIFELATVALDKLFFMLALNSWRGLWGTASRWVASEEVKSPLLHGVAPICNLMWGQGIFNHHVAGVVSLACCTNYQMPALLAHMATELPDAVWSREQHPADPNSDSVPTGAPAANVAGYKTPDYLLASVQDYRAGARGDAEMVWRATLGEGVVVFTNHPGSSSESASRTPGYWAGNGRLPRVAQWHDALISLHQLQADDTFGSTHAYFPTAAMDEHVLRAGWAFGRVGQAYVALTNSRGINMVAEGPTARRELRASGHIQAWVVQMGRAARDGNFAQFQAKVLAMPLEFGAGLCLEEGGQVGTVRFTTLRGAALQFGWTGPFLVNGEPVALDDFPHYENPYTTTKVGSGEMVVQLDDAGVRLDFGVG